ncbi:MAG: glycoside hydrolase family 78 protein [Chitinophagaceae bacterium]|nr:glycoside hydrolase family 78 protein [Chitinophagaceae bacterium]
MMKFLKQTFSAVFFLIASLVFLSFRHSDPPASFQIVNLRCEYLVNPLGIDVLNPRFSWEMVSAERGKSQKAYQVIVADNEEMIGKNEGNTWNSGKVASGESFHIRFDGKTLLSGKDYYWKIKIWDEQNVKSEWSEAQRFSMGMLDKKDWKAKWIGAPSVQPVTVQDENIIPPSPLLRKEFAVKKRVKKAKLYATALGVYEMYLNNKKVGDRILAPEWTDYFTRVQYQTYDVTDMLLNGDNVIGGMLADGWYAGVLFTHGKPQRGNYGFDRRLLAQLEIEFTDGTKDVVVTDESWKILLDGPMKEASIFDGEVFDARYIPANWQKPGLDIQRWDDVAVDNTVKLTVNAQINEPIRVVKEIRPVHVFRAPNGNYIFDMGQNMAGWVHIKLPYNPGKKIIMRHAEILMEDSTLYTQNLRTAKQTDIYIPARETTIDYEPRFTYHGFRFVEVAGLTEPPTLDNITGKVVASAASLVSGFNSSHKDVNQLWKNIMWTQLSNLHSIPEDCPQRDERCGWMGDAQIFCQTAIYNMDLGAFYTKWFKDIRDRQTPEGRYPNYAPQVGMVFYDAPGWTDAGIIIPWRAYLNYGDKRMIEQHYGSMKSFIDHVHKENPNLIRVNAAGQNYGDWVNGNTIKAEGYPTDKGDVARDLFNTAFFAYSTQILADASRVIGKKKEYAYYSDLAKKIREVFVKEFVGKNGEIKGGTQAGYALALEFNLVPEHLRAKSAKLMVDAIAEYDYRVSTGIQTITRMMNQLSRNGYTEVAYQLLESRRFPSWIYSIDQGATTIWERWDGYVKGRGFQRWQMNSFNQYAIGSVGEWMHNTIIGINCDETQPGYRHFMLKPTPGGSLTWATGSYKAITGRVEVSWKKQDGELTVEVDIPANTTATLVLPSGKNITENGRPVPGDQHIKILKNQTEQTTLKLASGKYRFSMPG